MAAAKKTPAPKKMTLKKQKKVTTPLVHPYKVRFGTRNTLGPEHQFATEAATKEAIMKAFHDWDAWCRRYNTDGLDAIKAAATEASVITFHRERSRIECIFDEHTGMHVCAEYWTTR